VSECRTYFWGEWDISRREMNDGTWDKNWGRLISEKIRLNQKIE